MNKIYSLLFSAALLVVGGYFLFFYDSPDARATGQPSTAYRVDKGPIFGTFYTVKYRHPDHADLHEQILAALHRVDQTLSMFNPNSQLSALNANRSDTVSSDFQAVYECAREVWERSDHAFDITVAPLVDLWGFGRDELREVSAADVQTLMPAVGMDKIRLAGNRLIKDDPAIRIDASAIAKGYGVDAVAAVLAENGCSDFIVEIGGEIVARGINDKGEPWHVGINTPDDDPANTSNDVQRIIPLINAALATSGNYRRYYEVNGKRYAHTIDPRTGYPAQTDVLSATVIAPTCMRADAYATAFMVLGSDKAMEICGQDTTISCFLILGTSGEEGYTTVMSKNFEK